MSTLTKIAELNDLLRTTMLTGRVMVTDGIASLSAIDKAAIFDSVRSFDRFTPDNDPYGEHDFGAIDHPGVGKVFWKIDYYDRSLSYGSDDPADPSKTSRVLTIMLAEEY